MTFCSTNDVADLIHEMNNSKLIIISIRCVSSKDVVLFNGYLALCFQPRVEMNN